MDWQLDLQLIGQQFDDPKYFWGRLSATSPYPYNAAASSGSNLGPTNPALLDVVKARIAALKAADPDQYPAHPRGLGHLPPVADWIQTSVSPLLSTRSASCKSARFERSGCDRPGRSIYRRASVWFPGEPRVNVLELNLALDAAQ